MCFTPLFIEATLHNRNLRVLCLGCKLSHRTVIVYVGFGKKGSGQSQVTAIVIMLVALAHTISAMVISENDLLLEHN